MTVSKYGVFWMPTYNPPKAIDRPIVSNLVAVEVVPYRPLIICTNTDSNAPTTAMAVKSVISISKLVY